MLEVAVTSFDSRGSELKLLSFCSNEDDFFTRAARKKRPTKQRRASADAVAPPQAPLTQEVVPCIQPQVNLNRQRVTETNGNVTPGMLFRPL